MRREQGPTRSNGCGRVLWAVLSMWCCNLGGPSPFLHAQPATPWPQHIDPYLPLVKQMGLPPELLKALQPILLRDPNVADTGPKPVSIKARDLMSSASDAMPASVNSQHPPDGTGKAATLSVETARVALPLDIAPVHPSSDSRPSTLVTPVDVRQAAYLERVRQGDQSPEVLVWVRSLAQEDLVKLIEQTPDWQWEDKRLRQVLAAALVEVYGVSPEKTTGISDAALVTVADYYRDHGDERCIRLYERALSSRKTRSGPVPELYGLAGYYRKTNDLKKAAEAYLRSVDYSTDNATLGNATVQAARAFMEAGDEQKANELYATVPKYGYGWATGLARWDQGHRLISQGKHEEARRVLKQPLTGQFADQIQVALLVALAHSYYRTGEFDASRKYCEEAILQYSSLADPLKGHSLESQLLVARVSLEWIDHWTKEALVCDPSEIRAILSRAEMQNEPLTVKIGLRTFRPIPLTVTSSDPRIKVRPVGSANDPPEDKTYFFQKMMVVEVDSRAAAEGFKATLLAHGPGLPQSGVQVPVIIEVK